MLDVVKNSGIYSVCNAFATKNIGHFSIINTGECPFDIQILCLSWCKLRKYLKFSNGYAII